MKICRLCFQNIELCQDGQKCHPVSCPKLSFTFSSPTPYSVILKVLQEANIKVLDSCAVVFNTSDYVDEYPASEMSVDEEPEEEHQLLAFLRSFIENKDNIKLQKRQTLGSYFKAEVLEHLNSLTTKEQYEQAFKLIEKIAPVIYPKSSTRDVFYTSVRSELKKAHPTGSEIYICSLENMKIERDERKELQSNYVKQVKQKNKQQREVKRDDILQIIETLRNKENADVYDKTLLGLVISGCRPCELLQKNEYKLVDERYVEVSNIAKKRKGKTDQTCTRPIIELHAQEFLDLVQEIRTVEKQEQAFKRNLHNRCNKLFDGSPSLLRKIYGNLSHQLYSPDVNLNVYLSEALGHNENDLQTSFSYSTVKIV
jgi:integrase